VKALENIAKQKHLPFIDIRKSIMLYHSLGKNIADTFYNWIHVNQKGQDVIAEFLIMALLR
jgi:hypothetical protein